MKARRIALFSDTTGLLAKDEKNMPLPRDEVLIKKGNNLGWARCGNIKTFVSYE